MWVPVDRNECDGAGSCGFIVLSDDVLEGEGLGCAGPGSSGVYVAWARGEI